MRDDDRAGMWGQVKCTTILPPLGVEVRVRGPITDLGVVRECTQNITKDKIKNSFLIFISNLVI